MKIINLLLLILLSYECYSQNNNIYIFENRYEHSIEKLNSKTSFDLKPIKILGQYMIDPKRNGVIKYELVGSYIDKLYPAKNVMGILCINLEGALFSQLRDNNKNTKEFNDASNKYIQLVKFIKNILPNIEVGIYGLPFKGYYDSQLKKNDHRKLDPLLKEVDVLFPSLYIAYPAKQKGIHSNIEYLQKNLDIAFEYGNRVNKPIYPFFWYLIHPTNKKYGSAFIPKEEYYTYLNFINSYRYRGKNVSGIVWWDTPTPFNNGTIKNILIPENQHEMLKNLDDVFEYYIDMK